MLKNVGILWQSPSGPFRSEHDRRCLMQVYELWVCSYLTKESTVGVICQQLKMWSHRISECPSN
jgi:hypothetical protein